VGTPAASHGCHPEPQRRVCRAGCRDASLRLSMTVVLSTCHALAIARYKQRILTTKKHAHNKPIAVLKNTAQSERYVGAIQSFIEKESNSYDSSSRIGSTTCKRKRRHGESSVGKVAGLVHVLHKDGSIRAEIYRASRCFAAAQHDRMGTPAASHGCHPEPQRRSVALGIEMLRCGSA